MLIASRCRVVGGIFVRELFARPSIAADVVPAGCEVRPRLARSPGERSEPAERTRRPVTLVGSV